MKEHDVNSSTPEQFLGMDEMLELTGKSRATLCRWSRSGTFPAPYRLGNGTVAWKQSEYIKWTQELQKVEYK